MAYKLTRGALAWWETIQNDHRIEKKAKVSTWEKNAETRSSTVLTVILGTTLVSPLQKCAQGQSVHEYTT